MVYDRAMTETTKGQLAQIIKTPQELVHIKHKISLLQYKYWVLMLRAYRDEYVKSGNVGESYCYLSMESLVEQLGYTPKKRDIEEDLEAIRTEPIIFNVLEKDKQQAKTGQGFISLWSVSTKRIGVVFPPILRAAVENLDSRQSIFHLLNWSIFNSFTGKYEAILYKLCKDYVGVGRTKYMTLDAFRQYMGVPADEYQDFKRLSQWVISGPMKKINASDVSDIEISSEFDRVSRRVVGLFFVVKAKKQALLDFGCDPAFRFAKVTIAQEQQRKYIEQLGSDLVASCLQRANEYAEAQEGKGVPVDYGAIYRTAITENWGQEFQARKALEAETELAAKKAKELALEAESKTSLARLEAEYRAHICRSAIDELTLEQRQAHAKTWLTSGKGVGQEDDYDAETGRFNKTQNKVNFERVYLPSVVTPPFSEQNFQAWRTARQSQ